MKAFGYKRSDRSDRDEELLSLCEVGFAATPSDLRQLSAFLAHAADLMDKHGADFGHEHLQDSWPDWNPENTDVIVAREED